MGRTMDWYPFYFRQHRSETMHLDPYQEGCYRRLIDHYMETRQPIPDNDHALARIVGDSYANWVANGGAIVRPFFKSKNCLLHHQKCDEILQKQERSIKKLSESGKKGAEKRWSKNKRLDGHPIATPMGSAIADIDIEEDTNVSSPPMVPPKGEDRPKEKPGRRKQVSETLPDPPDWIDPDRWSEFVQHRIAIKKPLSAPAAEATWRRLGRWREDGHDPNEILETSIANGWQGVFLPKNPGNHGGQGHAKTRNQQLDEALDRAEARIREQWEQDNRERRDLAITGPAPAELSDF